MCDDRFDGIRSLIGLLALVMAPVLLRYRLWLDTAAGSDQPKHNSVPT